MRAVELDQHAPVGRDLSVRRSARPRSGQRLLGITPRTLYRFIDEGQIPGYRFGRVIRLKQSDVDDFIEHSRIEPGTLEHLYPEVVGDPPRAS